MTGLHVALSPELGAAEVVKTDCCFVEPIVTCVVSDLLQYDPITLDENGALVLGEGRWKESIPNDAKHVVLCPQCNSTINIEVEEM